MEYQSATGDYKLPAEGAESMREVLTPYADEPPGDRGRITATQEDLTVTLQGQTLIWKVEENNRAVERANETDLASAVQTALQEVSWTAGTGGTVYETIDGDLTLDGNPETRAFGHGPRDPEWSGEVVPEAGPVQRLAGAVRGKRANRERGTNECGAQRADGGRCEIRGNCPHHR